MSGHAVALSATRRRRAHKIRPPARDRCGGLPRRDHPIGADTTPVRLPFRLLLGVARLPVSAESPNSDRNVFVHDGVERIVMYARDWTPGARRRRPTRSPPTRVTPANQASRRRDPVWFGLRLGADGTVCATHSQPVSTPSRSTSAPCSQRRSKHVHAVVAKSETTETADAR